VLFPRGFFSSSFSLHVVIDELIRQITINCAERGLLLLRVRDEARMTISAYETLYESSIAYGVRKALIAEQRKIDLDQKLKELQSNKRDLQQQVENLKNTIEMTQQRALEKREQEEKLHAEEVSIRLVLCYFSISYRCIYVVCLCLYLG
jgi:dynein light intermediate chain